MHESGLALFKRGATLRRKRASANAAVAAGAAGGAGDHKSTGCLGDIGPGPKDAWMIYCWLLTCCIPPALLRMCGTFMSNSINRVLA